MERVTIADVARLAGVSKSTVSQYLNKRYMYMSEETKMRIGQAIDTLGYHPNIIARSLKQRRTSTIGVIVSNILHSFSTQVIRAIEDTCRENDFHVIVCNADDDPAKEENYIQMLLAKQVDGMAIVPSGGNLDLYHSMVKKNYPVVFIDRIIEDVPIDVFLLDNENASLMAVEHLISLGHKKIGLVTPSLEKRISPRIERINGYKNALEKHQLPVMDEYIKSMKVNELQSGLKEIFSLPDPPTAVIASNDLTLFEILRFAKNEGFRIPEDLAVVGIDDVPFASILEPSLSIFSQPTFEIGNKAASLLLKKINKNKEIIEPRVHRFQPTLLPGTIPDSKT
ncbi:LacI family transcriptional regulator [Bacillus sp. FJAT-27225]|uniref:LacI family DNA-binding transcriptional regulator n=1 Tax=Bacillus sp. FJAT-27225 TaxID=1743144 RepID=UPI00080C23C7|nr:substrate-binding domain-containing protein [Bacillus sp. FJAT-27225]OCA88022.1 LacI family transcriptional regulator [Bacillus sp. FJAT-27225]